MRVYAPSGEKLKITDVLGASSQFDTETGGASYTFGQTSPAIDQESATRENYRAEVSYVGSFAQFLLDSDEKTTGQVDGGRLVKPVSYTHLDVYKRQAVYMPSRCAPRVTA